MPYRHISQDLKELVLSLTDNNVVPDDFELDVLARPATVLPSPVTLSKKASRCQVVPRSVPGPDVILRSGNSLSEFTPSQN